MTDSSKSPSDVVVEQRKSADSIQSIIWTQNTFKLLQADNRIGWPTNPSKLNELHHGWFRPGNVELLKAVSGIDNLCIIELGSWLGASTKFIIEKNPNAIVFAVDIWSNEYFLSDTHYDKSQTRFANIINSNPIYDQFLANMQKYKYSETNIDSTVKGAGLIPMKMDSLEALKILHEADIVPDFIYIDASHHYDYVVKDINMCLNLFPKAIIVGDDWDNIDVKRAVKFVMSQRGINNIYIRNNTCWTFAKDKVEKIFAEEEEKERIEALIKADERKRLTEFKNSSLADQLNAYKKSRKQ